MNKTLRTIVAAGALALGAATASAQTADLHTERFDSTAIVRAELFDGYKSSLRLEENTTGNATSYRFGTRVPLGKGFISAFGQRDTQTGLGVNFNTNVAQHGTTTGFVGGEFEKKGSAHIAGLYGTVTTPNVLIAAGGGELNRNVFEHGIATLVDGSYRVGGGFVHSTNAPDRYHAFAGRFANQDHTQPGFIFHASREGTATAATLLLAPNANYGAGEILGPDNMDQGIHRGSNLRAFTNVTENRVLPGVPPHVESDGPGTLQLGYTNDAGVKNISADARFFPTGKLHNNGDVERLMVGARYDSHGNTVTPIVEFIWRNLDVYMEKTPGKNAYFFAGWYQSVGGKK